MQITSGGIFLTHTVYRLIAGDVYVFVVAPRIHDVQSMAAGSIHHRHCLSVYLPICLSVACHKAHVLLVCDYLSPCHSRLHYSTRHCACAAQQSFDFRFSSPLWQFSIWTERNWSQWRTLAASAKCTCVCVSLSVRGRLAYIYWAQQSDARHTYLVTVNGHIVSQSAASEIQIAASLVSK